MPTSTVENYLKSIYKQSQGSDGRVSLSEIAQDLNVTAGTVTSMMKTLAEGDLVEYEPWRGVTMTERGSRAALRVLRRHRLIELFLVEVMKLDWSMVHEEAEALEHVVSDTLIDRMDEMLEYPARDPHGDPIPNAEGALPSLKTVALSDCDEGRYQLVRVLEDTPGFLVWLKDRHLRPGCTFVLKEKDSIAGLISLEREGFDSGASMSIASAEKLRVVPLEAE